MRTQLSGLTLVIFFKILHHIESEFDETRLRSFSICWYSCSTVTVIKFSQPYSIMDIKALSHMAVFTAKGASLFFCKKLWNFLEWHCFKDICSPCPACVWGHLNLVIRRTAPLRLKWSSLMSDLFFIYRTYFKELLNEIITIKYIGK